MLELVGRVNWDEYHLFLSQGMPPIALQLLVLNAMLVAYLMYCRIRKTGKKSKSRQGGGWVLPVLFLAGNYSVVNWGGKLSL
jgi:hypothetical protein